MKMSNTPKPNYYDILEISQRARPEVINAAYKALVKNYHPDATKGDDRILKLLNEAKDTLLDTQKREEYDRDRTSLEGKIVGNYRIIEQIAEGGFGKTYRGEQIHLGAPVCLKHGHYISPQDEKLLMEEAASIWDLRHYSIPTMRDFFKMDDGSPVLVMSYVPGPTLEQIIKKVGKLDPEHVCWIAERSLNALKYLHYNGVVHGDVKPQNIIIQPESHMIVLVDYGLSIIRPSWDSKSKGYTPYFASPEQIAGKTLIPESDLYSLGITMIYALGGDIETKRVPASVPDSLCKFIRKLVVRDVIYRPNWAKEDLCETISNLRYKEFGRKSSNMKPIPGI
jgi:serine/threonine protein kinase